MIDEPEPVPKPSKVSQEIEVVLGDPSKVLKISSALSASKKTKITNFLRENQDILLGSMKICQESKQESSNIVSMLIWGVDQCSKNEKSSHLNAIR